MRPVREKREKDIVEPVSNHQVNKKRYTAHSICYDKKTEGFRLVTLTIEDDKVVDRQIDTAGVFDTVAAKYAFTSMDFFKGKRWLF